MTDQVGVLEQQEERLKRLAAQAKAGIPPDGSVWQLRERCEDSEPRNYLLGIQSQNSAYHNVVLLGISFEKTRGYYNKVTRTWRYEDGRTEILPEALAEAIREEAKHRHLFCKLYYDNRGRVVGVKKCDEADDRDPRGARAIRRRSMIYDKDEGRVTHKWIPLSDMIILREVGEHEGRVTTVDVLHAEMRNKEDRIAELERLLAQARKDE